jgi:putative SOS response-associated peptidase YedK
VVRRHSETTQRHLDLLKWRRLPYWTKEPTKAQRPINAPSDTANVRSDTAVKSGMFRGALARRRCIVHADAFYEWKVVEGGKQPYAIARQDGRPLAFAGIWESFCWPDETEHRSFAIMTTRPNAEMDELHDRMPVILEEQDWPVWLAEGDGDHGARSCGRRRMHAAGVAS